MAGMGHEDAFPRRRLSARCRFSQETFAGTRGNGRDAPKPAISVLPIRRRIKPALLFGEPIDQHVEEPPHLGAQLPAMGVARDNLHLRSPVIGQQRHQGSGGEKIGNDIRGVERASPRRGATHAEGRGGSRGGLITLTPIEPPPDRVSGGSGTRNPISAPNHIGGLMPSFST
jgi:hypothetical protein